MKKMMLVIILVMLVIVTGCEKSYVKEISYKEYQEMIKNKDTFILEIMRTECSACIKFSPKLKEVADEYKVEVKYINTDNLTEEELNSFDITGTPTVMFFIKGEEETTSARIGGNVSRDKIISKFKASGFINE